MIKLIERVVEVDDPPYEGVQVMYDYDMPQMNHFFVFNRRLRRQDDDAVGLAVGVRVPEYPCISGSLEKAYALAIAAIKDKGGFDAVAERRQAGQECKILSIDTISMER
jgi:hypothetical protein